MTRRGIAKFDLEVSHSQISVFDANLKDPFNDWKDGHLRQGFAWRPGSVSFGTLVSGTALCEVYLASTHLPRAGIARSICVPFELNAGGAPVIATIGEEIPIPLPCGAYALIFEHGILVFGERMSCIFTFVPAESSVTPAILTADSELSTPPTPLLMEADPA